MPWIVAVLLTAWLWVIGRDSLVLLAPLIGLLLAWVWQLQRQVSALRDELAERPVAPQAAPVIVRPAAPPVSPAETARPVEEAPPSPPAEPPPLSEPIPTPSAAPKREPLIPLRPRQVTAAQAPPHTAVPTDARGASSALPGAPDWATRLFERARAWLFGGNTLVRVGVVILFFGLAFLLKYAAEHARLPLWTRYAGVGAGTLLLLGIGWRLRARRPGYARALQGGAVGALYLLTFAAFRLHGLLPPGAALGVLLLVAVLAAALAVLQDAQALAALGTAGGFLAPVLASTGSGNHVMLFSYYALLNAGILGIAWYKAWRPLNLLGFVFTFGIGALWGGLKYQPALFASTDPFLALFFVMYVGVAILYAARRQAASGADGVLHYARDAVDGTLVFGVPLVGFGLQYALVHDREFGPAFSALAIAAFYLLLATMLLRRARYRLLGEAFVALGTVFGSLAIPLALDAQWSSGAWALEAAGIVWIGLRQGRLLARGFAYLLLLGAGVIGGYAYMGLGMVPPTDDALVTTGVLLAVGGAAVAALLAQADERRHPAEAAAWPVALGFGLLWWSLAGWHAIDHHVALDWQPAAIAAGVAASALLLVALGRAWPGFVLGAHPLAHGVAALWLFAAGGRMLWHATWQVYGPPPTHGVLVSGALAAIGTWLTGWLLQRYRERLAAWEPPLALLAVWLGLMWWGGGVLAWALPRWPAEALALRVLLGAVSVGAMAGLAPRLRWPALAQPAVALLPWLALNAGWLIDAPGLRHPSVAGGWLAWPLAFVVHTALLRWREAAFPSRIRGLWHALAALLLIGLLTWEAAWQLADLTPAGAAWPWFAALAVGALAAWGLYGAAGRWPVAAFPDAYHGGAGATLAALLYVGALLANGHDGRAAPLPYSPLFNPLDLAQALALLAAWRWARAPWCAARAAAAGLDRAAPVLLCAALFVCLTGVLLRALHHYGGVPYHADALWHATLVQAALSLFWGVLALLVMLTSTRRGWRVPWLVGAALMAVVVVKLFLVDLSQVGGLQRVASFIGVGVLLLVLGYFSPVPPRRPMQGDAA